MVVFNFSDSSSCWRLAFAASLLCGEMAEKDCTIWSQTNLVCRPGFHSSLPLTFKLHSLSCYSSNSQSGINSAVCLDSSILSDACKWECLMPAKGSLMTLSVSSSKVDSLLDGLLVLKRETLCFLIGGLVELTKLLVLSKLEAVSWKSGLLEQQRWTKSWNSWGCWGHKKML